MAGLKLESGSTYLAMVKDILGKSHSTIVKVAYVEGQWGLLIRFPGSDGYMDFIPVDLERVYCVSDQVQSWAGGWYQFEAMVDRHNVEPVIDPDVGSLVYRSGGRNGAGDVSVMLSSRLIPVN